MNILNELGDLAESNFAEIKAKKKRLNELMDLYGENKIDIENKATNTEYMEYILAEPYVDEVLYERSRQRMKYLNGVGNALNVLQKNYFDMKRDNTIGSDNYFHCKANYEASKFGENAERISEIVSNSKEVADYFRNRLFKNMNYVDAYSDYLFDRHINERGRQLAKSSLYSSSKDACKHLRVRGINEKY